MIPFVIDISEILDAPGLSVSVDGEYALPELVVGDEVFVLSSPARVHATVSNAGEGFVATGSVVAEVTATCSRCLCDFPLAISGEVEGFWTRPGHETTVEGASELDDDGSLDLAESLVAALVVEAPFAPVHDPDCAGLCPTCGADLNVESCGCAGAEHGDHPFAGLAALLDEFEDEPSGE